MAYGPKGTNVTSRMPVTANPVGGGKNWGTTPVGSVLSSTELGPTADSLDQSGNPVDSMGDLEVFQAWRKQQASKGDAILPAQCGSTANAQVPVNLGNESYGEWEQDH